MVKSQAAVVAALFLGSFAMAPQGWAQTLPAPVPQPKASPAARTAQQAQPAKPPAAVAQPVQQPQPAAAGPKFGLPSQPLQVGISPQALIIVETALERLIKRVDRQVKLLP